MDSLVEELAGSAGEWAQATHIPSADGSLGYPDGGGQESTDQYILYVATDAI